MEIRTSRQSILPASAVAPLCERSDLRGLAHLAAHLALLALTGALIAATAGWWRLPALVLHGIVLTALFAPLHESVHRTAFRSRWLNDVVATVIGLLLVLPAGYYRRFHFAHHRFTQDPKRDPELAIAKPETPGRYLLYLSGAFYWRAALTNLLRHAAGRVQAPFVPARERRQVVWEARVHLVFYAAVLAPAFAGTMTLALWYWLLPVLLGQPFLRGYLLAEHTGCPEMPEDMLANTRTVLGNRPVRSLMWNMPFHTEHHTFPAVPFHALPRLHALMAAKLQATAPGYGAFHRGYLAALRNGEGKAFVHPPLLTASAD
ncbi:MAG TPA: fatty acid desaturase [Alphaproteobacteria bacterium]|nr:fatty acid desaturase [Alphaproteobacteria bacterium]